ncbi:MAG: flagellar biosynthesis protein FlhB [Clostridia bacterium]|nr:flagellar biosynthesis protein FlhB [Clostridia bacterium]
MDENLLRIDLQLFAEEEKTEEATPHRLREVRKEGQVARSNDLNAVMNLLAVFLLIMFLDGYFTDSICLFVQTALSQGIHRMITQTEIQYIFLDSSIFMFKFLAPIFAAGLFAGLTANLGQVGFTVSTKVLEPKLSNLNPIQGFKRIFSKRALVELAKALLKVVVVGWVAFSLARNNFTELLNVMNLSQWQILGVVSKIVFKVATGAIGVFFVIAVLDYIFQRYDFKKRVRMTKKEVKDEFKQTEGDPLVRAKIRESQRQLAQRRMMHSVPEATVVITNPTHLAIALRYEVDDEEGAPMVLAKGAGYIAEKIIEIAKGNDIPVIEDKPVTQLIYKHVEINEEIPPELYKAVAEILAMVYRLRR